MPSGENLVTHGMSRSIRFKQEYAAWKNMKQRCLNRTNEQYDDYGGRGITICDAWINSFEEFLQHVGEKPAPKNAYSLDRIENSGNYELGNVRWATRGEQQENRRKQSCL